MKRIGELTRLLCVTISLLSTVDASAQESDHSAGLAVARQMCSECHAVEGNIATSPNLSAPMFSRIANTPGMRAKLLRYDIATMHETTRMPEFNLKAEEVSAIVDYILSLQRSN
jgi:mono/diheme cytochrome c family protein